MNNETEFLDMIDKNSPLSLKVKNTEILNQGHELVEGFSLDGPIVGTTAKVLDFTICGWILSSGKRPLVSIEISLDGFQLKRIPINVPRPDVMEAMGRTNEPNTCGFDTRIGLVGLPDDTQIEVIAVFRGDAPQQRVKVPVARIEAEKYAHLQAHVKYQPLMLTSIGRSGTTWLMRLLSEHREILTSNFYPYEVKQSAYWMQMLKIMTDPADFAFSSHPDKFDVTMCSIGHNPYTYPHYLNSYNNTEEFNRYYSNEMVTLMRDFVVDRVDDFYSLVARSENKPAGKYYAEKFVPAHLQSVYKDIYSAAKEIILVRDFRDVICSAKSFNEKRNSVSFGRELVSDDFEWVEHISSTGIKLMAKALEERRDTAFLIKYENLITQPEKVLREVFEYLEIDASEHVVKAVIAGASAKNETMEAHRTTKNPADSIGRWRRDMSEDMQKLCAQEMGPMLALFGYDV